MEKGRSQAFPLTRSAAPVNECPLKLFHQEKMDAFSSQKVVAFRPIMTRNKTCCSHCQKQKKLNVVVQASSHNVGDVAVGGSSLHESRFYCQGCREVVFFFLGGGGVSSTLRLVERFWAAPVQSSSRLCSTLWHSQSVCTRLT